MNSLITYLNYIILFIWRFDDYEIGMGEYADILKIEGHMITFDLFLLC